MQSYLLGGGGGGLSILLSLLAAEIKGSDASNFREVNG